MSEISDRIEKRVSLRAPIARVWRAVTDAKEFGAWFGVEFGKPFAAGAVSRGKVVPTKADPVVAKTQEAYAGTEFDFTVETIEPMRLFSFRWHPFAVDPKVDYSGEPTTLVTFELSETTGGTLLVITETGFNGIPLARRAKAFAMNDHGWTDQAGLLEKYLAHAS